VLGFGQAVGAVLGSILTEDLVGTYVVGSVALGGYVSGQSDVDIVAVCERRGAAWARHRWSAPSLIDAAVELRHGRPARLDAEEVDRLLEHVEGVLARADGARGQGFASHH